MLNSVALGSNAGALGVLEFIRSPCVCSLGVVVFIRCRWVRPGVRWVHSGSLGSRGCTLGRVGGGGGGVTLVGPEIRPVHSGRWVHSGASRGSSDSLGVFAFTRVRRWGRPIHSGSFRQRPCVRWVVGGC